LASGAFNEKGDDMPYSRAVVSTAGGAAAMRSRGRVGANERGWWVLKSEVGCNPRMDEQPGKSGSRGAEAPSDAELMRGIAADHPESFQLLFRRWAPRLRRFLIRATGSTEAGEDLLQETFLRVLRAASRFIPRGEVRAWLFQIAANLAYSFWRREGKAHLTAGDPAGALASLAAPHHRGPETLRARAAFSEEVERSLIELPPNQRMVFLLKVDQGMTYQDVAVVMNCPVGTVKSRFHHALLKLRDDLRDWREEPGSRAVLPSPGRGEEQRGASRTATE
jgi:RNA polymerase sigma-70 factor, ECF subfamily